MASMAATVVPMIASAVIGNLVSKAFSPKIESASTLQPQQTAMSNVPQVTTPTPNMPETPGTPAASPSPQSSGGGAAATDQEVAQGSITSAKSRRGRLSTILSQRSRITEPLGGLYDSETLG